MSSPPPGAEQAVFAAALSTLPGMGPAGLAQLLAGRQPEEVWDDIRAGRIVRPRSRRSSSTQPALEGLEGPERAVASNAEPPSRAEPSWKEAARSVPRPWWARAAGRGIAVTWIGQPDYPSGLINDPERPGVLFYSGRIGVSDGLCVAIVGTRNATVDGRSTAFEMGRDLTEAGVCVISGLALGIDGAAHTGAVEAAKAGAKGAPLGVAASGVDVPYPRQHADLWSQVAGAGAVISETPPGRPAQAWRFPARNRIIAGLSQLVVVVESHLAGGSLITAEAALQRGIEVRAVPGPVRSPASAGSNQLLYDGPGPVRDAQDVLDALGMFEITQPRLSSAGGHPTRYPAGPVPGPEPSARPGLDRAASAVLDALGWRPANPGQIMTRTGLSAAEVIRALDQLESVGAVRTDSGWWSRRR